MPEPPPSLPPLREVIARHRLGARHSLGQHFLLDLNLTRRIARAAGDMTGVTAVEIGPGPGGLTRALLETDARCVIAIERDPRCVAALAELAAAYPDRLEIVEGDALEIDAAALARERGGGGGSGGGPVKIVANLPYNIATELLIGWLRDIDAYGGLVLMFQKEVAERLAASPRTSAYGRLSIVSQWLCRVERLFDVSPRAFVPPPRVTSSVVGLTPLAAPLAPAAMADLERVTAAAFGQRRKMLRSALKTLVADPTSLLDAAGISGTARAEELAVEQFCTLARLYRQRAG